MTKRIYAALISLAAAVAAALSFAGPADAAAWCDGHQCQHGAARHTRRRVARKRARVRDSRRAVAYVCPMHSDIRERSRGTCPKCLMDLVAEPRGPKVNARGAGASASGGR